MKKRVLSILLVMLMVLSLLPTTALAGTQVFEISSDEAVASYKCDSLDAAAIANITARQKPVTVYLLENHNGTIDFQGKTLTLDLWGYNFQGEVKNAENVTVTNTRTSMGGKLAAVGTYAKVPETLVDTNVCAFQGGTYTNTVSTIGVTPYTVTYSNEYDGTYGGTATTNSLSVTEKVNPGDSITLRGGADIDKITASGTSGATIDVAAFGGWIANGTPYDPGDSFTPEGNITITVDWTPYHTVKYAITSPVDATSTTNSERILKGTVINLPKATATAVSGFTGYTLSDWKTPEGDAIDPGNSYTVTGDVTLTAEFVVSSCAIKYVNDNNTALTALDGTSADVNEEIDLNNAAGIQPSDDCENCVFDGWLLVKTGKKIEKENGVYEYQVKAKDISPDGTITFKATWKHVEPAKTYTVKYYLDAAAYGVDSGASVSVTEGGSFTFPAKDKLDLTGTKYASGAEFLGWHKYGDSLTLYKPGETYIITEDNVKFIGAWATCELEYCESDSTTTTVIMTKYVEPGTSITLSKADALSKTGYTFKGWIDSSTGDVYDPGAQFDVPKGATSVKLFTKWVENDKLCTVTYLEGKGAAKIADLTQSVENGKSIRLNGSATLNNPGYIFDGWVDANTGHKYDAGYVGYVVNGDVNFYATWKEAPKTYTVTFYDGLTYYQANKAAGKNLGQQENISYNEWIQLPGSASYNLRAQDFIGWLCPDTNEMCYATDSFNVKADTDFVAIFKSDKLYKVTYNLNGGTYKNSGVTEGSIVKNATEDATVLVQNISDLNDFVRTGYTFKGWKLDYNGKTYNAKDSSEGGASFIMPAKNVTLTAVWEKDKPYTVTYKLNGGTYTEGSTTKYTLDTMSYNAKETITVLAPDLKREGYTFVGWEADFDKKTYKAGGANAYFEMPEQNVVLTAVWEPIATYRVTYILNGGIYKVGEVDCYEISDIKDYKVGDIVTVSDVTLKNGTKTFLGWRSSYNADLLYKAGAQFAMPGSNVTLTADWAQKYTVEFKVVPKTGAKQTGTNADYTAATLADQEVIDGQQLTTVAEPEAYDVTNNGVTTTYYFDGWQINDTNEKWDFADNFDSTKHVDATTHKLTLTALWSTEKHYTVVFKDKITDMYANGNNAAEEEAQYVLYNGKQLYTYYNSGAYGTTAPELTLTNVAEGATIGYGNQTTGANQYPAFERVDYTLGNIEAADINNRENDWYVIDPLGKHKFNYDAEKSLKANFVDNSYNIDDFADANGVITLWANWTYNYTPDADGYNVKIDTTKLSDATYAEYYSDYIVATTDSGDIGGGRKDRIYRNFFLTDGPGYSYTSPTHSITGLPEGLYLNKLTGEIYGVPKETGTFTFNVKMESDAKVNAEATEGAKQISDVYTITITINALPISADRIDDPANIFDKTYGDTDAAAYNLNDNQGLQGKIYESHNLTIKLGKDETTLATAATAIDSGLANVSLTTSTTDATAKLAFAYTDAKTNREAQIAKGKNPTNSDWLKCVDMKTVGLDTVFAGFEDTLTFPVVRTEGEDAGKYKLYLTDDSVTYSYGAEATKANAAAADFNPVYDLTIPEAFATDKVNNAATKYVFTINPVTLTLKLQNKEYSKTYGENDSVYPTNDLTVVTNNTTSGQATTVATPSDTTTLTIKYPMGFTDTLVVAPTRDFGEDISGTTSNYALKLTENEIKTTATDKTDKSIAHERENDNVKANYKFSLTYTGNKLTINARELKFVPDSATTYTYGTLKPGDVLKGSFETGDEKGLANNESIGVVDEAIAKISSTASGAGYLKAGNYNQTLDSTDTDNRQISFAITNTLWSGETGAKNATAQNTAGNYTITADLTVAKAGTLKVTGNTVRVLSGTKPTEENIAALATLSGVLTNGDKKDDVTLTVSKYAATVNGATVEGTSAAAFATALESALGTAGLTADLTVTVTYAVSGADKDNYVLPTVPVTGTLDAYTVSSSGGGGGGGGGSASYKVDVDKTTHGDASSDRTSASSGTKVTVTVDPDKGYTVDTVTVTNSKNKEVELTKKSDTEYTFIMPSGNVTVNATFAEDDDMSNYFVDVNKGDYDYDAVFWAIRKGITEGTDATHFSPEWTCTRGQIVTFLWRAAGSPEPKSADNPFVDVVSSAYYAKAVQWASENGIAKGTTDTTFEPNLTCTRAQCVAFIARALGAKDATGSVSFTDVPSDAWYEGYVSWAVENDITEGIGGGLFGPDQNCTRGQIVTFLYRAYNN